MPDISLEGATASVGDTDGDGRAEIIGGESSQHLFSGWGLNAAGGVEGESLQARAGNGDVNGDGLEDFLEDRWNSEREVSELRVRRNSGNGFDSRSTVPVPDDWPGRTIRDVQEGFAAGQMRVVDFNNDGQSDILIMRNGAARLYQWTGAEFARADEFGPVDPGEQIGQNVQPMDYNGDGLMDIVSTTQVAGSEDRKLRIFKRLGQIPDQLVRIGDPIFSPTVEVSYANLADRSVHVPATRVAAIRSCARSRAAAWWPSTGSRVGRWRARSRGRASTTTTKVPVSTCTVVDRLASPGMWSNPWAVSPSPTSTTRPVR